MEFSPEEKQQLAKRFREEMARQKAQELGVSSEDLVIRVENGKVNWVQKAKVYSELEKQRQLASPKNVIRSLRGEDNLVNRIKHEVEALTSQLENPFCNEVLTGLEKSDSRTSLSKIQNRTESLASDLGTVERRIESIKNEDSTFKEGEAVLVSMHKAKQANEQQKLAELAANHKDLLILYNTRRKNLEPLMVSAREHRLELQREYWRVLQTRWKLDGKWIACVQKKILDKENQEGTNWVETERMLSLFIKQLEHLNERQQELADRCPPRQVEIELAMGALDHILPDMKDVTDEQTEIRAKYEYLLTNASKRVMTGEKEAGPRMVFMEKKGGGASG